MAANGIATIAINVVGHGSGPLGTLTVRQMVGDPQMSRNPHGFAFAIADPSALAREIARGPQQRVALFLASGGELIIHPEPARFFEVPIILPLPEGLSYIP
jgi:hypothetical protein